MTNNWIREIEVLSSRSGGAGGQHVNKVATKVTLRWQLEKSAFFSEEEKQRIALKLHTHINKEGFLVVYCSDTRSQLENKRRAFAKIEAWIAKALTQNKRRVATKIPKSGVEKRLKEKQKHSEKKKERRKGKNDLNTC